MPRQRPGHPKYRIGVLGKEHTLTYLPHQLTGIVWMITRTSTPEDAPLPAHVKTKHKQILERQDWLQTDSGIINDQPGLGKTIMALGWLALMVESGVPETSSDGTPIYRPTQVECPNPSVPRQWWEDIHAHFSSELTYLMVSGLKEEHGVRWASPKQLKKGARSNYPLLKKALDHHDPEARRIVMITTYATFTHRCSTNVTTKFSGPGYQFFDTHSKDRPPPDAEKQNIKWDNDTGGWRQTTRKLEPADIHGIDICDEGHTARNATTAISQLITRRNPRIRFLVMGSPTTNNFSEIIGMFKLLRQFNQAAYERNKTAETESLYKVMLTH